MNVSSKKTERNLPEIWRIPTAPSSFCIARFDGITEEELVPTRFETVWGY